MSCTILRFGVILALVSLFRGYFVSAELVGSSCFSETTEFLLFDDLSDFESAKRSCRGEGATLASISSLGEYFDIKELREGLGFISGFWIGIEDNGLPNTEETTRFSFVDGSEDTTFFRVNIGSFPWAPNEPNGASCTGKDCEPENCVEWTRFGSGPSDIFNDEQCSESKPFLCRRSQCTTLTTSPFTDAPTISPTTRPPILTPSPTGSPAITPSISTTSPTGFPAISPPPGTTPTISSPASPTTTEVSPTADDETIRMLFLGFAGASGVGIAALLFIIKKEKNELSQMKASFALKFPPEKQELWMNEPPGNVVVADNL